MRLTENCKETMAERVRRDPAFATALLDEATTRFSMGNLKRLA